MFNHKIHLIQIVVITSLFFSACSTSTTPPTGNCPEPVTVSSTFTEDTNWTDVVPIAGCVDYLVTRDLDNSKFKLVVEPDVIVAFSKDTGLLIKNEAKLIANGSAEKPILFTGAEKTRGFWRGLAFVDSDHSENSLDHVTIEYGGGIEYPSEDIRANLILTNSFTTSTVAVKNSTFRESAEYGVFLRIDVTLSDFSNNIVTKNALGAAWVYASSAHNLSGNSDYTGNDSDIVNVRSNAIDKTVNWANIAPYHILEGSGQSAFQVTGDGFLALEPGVTLIFDEDLGMVVKGKGISAVGTADKPVMLTGREKTRGYWKGLYISDTTEKSTLDFIIIEYGGSEQYSITDTPANLAVTQNFAETISVSVSNSTLRHSAGHGLYNRFNAVISDFTGNTLTQNALGAAYLDASSVASLLDSSSYVGNDVDRVEVNTNTVAIDKTATWYDLGVPFIIIDTFNKEGFQVDGAALTLNPGVEILFQDGMGMSIRNEGRLIAQGEEDNRISLKGDGVKWKGLDVFDSTANLAYVTIENGGSDAWGLVEGKKGNVTIRSFFPDAAPSASVKFGLGMSQTGADFGIVFGFGDAYASGVCAPMAPYYKPDDVPGKCD